MRKIFTVTFISTISILSIFAPISFMGKEKQSPEHRFSNYATDGKIDTTKYTEEDIELSFY